MTILFDVWLDGIIGSAETIADKEILQKVWVDGNRNITSMVDFYESYTKIFEDLDAERYIDEYTKSDFLDSKQKVAIREYLCVLKDFDETPYIIREAILDHKRLIDSDEWVAVEGRAQQLINLFKNYLTLKHAVSGLYNSAHRYKIKEISSQRLVEHIKKFVSENKDKFVSSNYAYQIKKVKIRKILDLNDIISSYIPDSETSEEHENYFGDEKLDKAISHFLETYFYEESCT